MKRINISSNGVLEDVFGYCRAVRIGNNISVSGTASVDSDGKVIGVGDIYAQTVQILKIIEKALTDAGASLKDVVRTRIYVTNIEEWKGVAKAHEEYFGKIRPASTLVEITRLALPELLVEIECDAIVIN